MAKTYKEFKWVTKVQPDDWSVSGSGWERVDGSSMFNWLTLYRVDLNNDGYCDWYVNGSAPVSTGGDRDSINTLYLGGSNGWLRIGGSDGVPMPVRLSSWDYDGEARAMLSVKGERPAGL